MAEVNESGYQELSLMNSLQQLKQLELNLEFTCTAVGRDFSSEEFIASRLHDSPTGQIRLLESILERKNMPFTRSYLPLGLNLL